MQFCIMALLSVIEHRIVFCMRLAKSEIDELQELLETSTEVTVPSYAVAANIHPQTLYSALRGVSLRKDTVKKIRETLPRFRKVKAG